MQCSVTLFHPASQSKYRNTEFASAKYLVQQVNIFRLGSPMSLTEVNLTIQALLLFKELPWASVKGIHGSLWRTENRVLKRLDRDLQQNICGERATCTLKEALRMKKPNVQRFQVFNCTECFQ